MTLMVTGDTRQALLFIHEAIKGVPLPADKVQQVIADEDHFSYQKATGVRHKGRVPGMHL
jgi:hypothetical protein